MDHSADSKYYTHSGRMGMVIPFMLLIGMPALAILAAAYSYIVYYCPFVGYVNVLFLGGLVYGGAMVINFVGKASKCRSPSMMTLMSFLVGLSTVYFIWVFFIKAYGGAEVSLIRLFLEPGTLMKVIIAINQEGWWQPSGIFQWILSGIEAVVVVGGFAFFGASAIDREVFCEECSRWCEPFETLRLQPDAETSVIEPDKLKPEQLLALEEAEVTDFPRFDAEVLQCGGCESLQAIRIERVTQEMDDGELKEQRHAIPGVLIQRG